MTDRPRKTLRTAAAVALAAAGLALAGCGGSDDAETSAGAGGAAAANAEPTNFMLEWTVNASQIWAISGKERGLFQKNGLNPEFQFPDDSATPVKALLAGKTDFALQLSNSAVIAKGEGAKIKVIGTLELLDVGMMVLQDEITDFPQLKGKTVGVGQTSWEQTCTDRMLAKYGMKKSDVKQVDPGYNLATPLLQGRLDGVNGSQYEQAIVESKSDKKTKVFGYASAGVCPYNPIQIVTTDEMIKKDPEKVRKMLKGIAASLEASMTDVQGSVDLFSDKYPDLDEKSDLAQWQASVPTFCGPKSEQEGLLYSDPAQYRGLIKIAKEAGSIEEEYPVSDLVDDSFLPETPITAPCANERYKQDPMSQVTR